MIKNTNIKSSAGFTIVELLVVVVIIGVLASIAFISYAGVRGKATEISVQADSTNAAKQLAMFKIDNGSYPQTIDCSQPNSSTNLCIRASGGNDMAYINDETAAPQAFSLYIYNSGSYYLTTETSVVQKVASLPKIWKQISAGSSFTCGIAFGNRVYCWGENGAGQLGNNSQTNSFTPVAVDMSGVLNGKTIKSITTGMSHTCAIASDSKAYCWGSGANGRLGNGGTSLSKVPVAVTSTGVLSGKTLVAISAGMDFTCALATDNKVYCWGAGSTGKLGNGADVDNNTPVAVSLGALTVDTLVVGLAHTCAVTLTDYAYCWGYNNKGQLGNNTIVNSNVPVAVNTGNFAGRKITKIAAGGFNTCSILTDSAVYCWGDNSVGQIGDNQVSGSRSMVPTGIYTAGVLSGKTIEQVTLGYDHVCVVDTLKAAHCWGNYDLNQNGYGFAIKYIPYTLTTTGTPMAGKTIKTISEHNIDRHTCVIASDDQAYCWGNNGSGALGNNLTANSYLYVTANQSP